VNNYYSRSYKATVGVDFALKVIDVDPHTRVHLQLWDVAGQERFGSMTRIYYKNAVGAFIVFDVDDIKTWQGVSNWRDDIKEKLYPEEDIPILLIGNKSDLLHDRSPCVPFEEMEDFAKKNNFIGWKLTSAKDNENISESVHLLLEHVLEYIKKSKEQEEQELEEERKTIRNLKDPSTRNFDGGNGNGNNNGGSGSTSSDSGCFCH